MRLPKFRSPSILMLPALALACVAGLVLPREARGDEADAIRSRAATYQSAFNRQDARAVAEHWSEDALYTLDGGGAVRGRQAIQGVFERMFADKGLRLRVAITSIRFVTPDVAVEEGIAQTAGGQAEPVESVYTALNVKRNGVWYIDNIREVDQPAPAAGAGAPNRAEKLKELEWLVGEWTLSDDAAELRTKCEWAKNRTFLTRSFTLHTKAGVESSGTQVIGWDASTNQFRSWTFDSQGGFSEGIWTHRGNHWACKSAGVLPDGKRASAEHILNYVDQNTLTWQAVGREVDGQILPNIEAITIVRVRGN